SAKPLSLYFSALALQPSPLSWGKTNQTQWERFLPARSSRNAVAYHCTWASRNRARQNMGASVIAETPASLALHRDVMRRAPQGGNNCGSGFSRDGTLPVKPHRD